MKKSVAHFAYLIILCVFFNSSACRKEEEEIIRVLDQDFIVESEFSPYLSDTVAMYFTNQNGDILYDTIVDKTPKKIKFKVDASDIVDINYISIFNQKLTASTYRDIKTGYYIHSNQACSSGLRVYEQIGTYEIKINGIHSIEYLIFPTSIKPEVEKNELDNYVIVKGKQIPGADFIISILPQNSQQMMSFNLKRNLVTKVNNHSTAEVNFNDFTPSVKKEIIMSKNSASWRYNAVATDETNKTILITETGPAQPSDLNTNKLVFYYPNIQLNKIRFQISENNLQFGDYSYNRILDQFPTNIEMYDPAAEILRVNQSEYDVKNNFNYDFSRIYFSGDDNFSWKIYEKKSSNLSRVTPKIPQFVKSAFNISGERKFNSINAKFYIVGNGFVDAYNTSSKGIDLNCSEYENKAIIKSF